MNERNHLRNGNRIFSGIGNPVLQGIVKNGKILQHSIVGVRAILGESLLK